MLTCIAEGMTDLETAVELSMGRWTVKSHAVRVLQKLRAKNRANAVAIAYHKGILEVPAKN